MGVVVESEYVDASGWKREEVGRSGGGERLGEWPSIRVGSAEHQVEHEEPAVVAHAGVSDRVFYVSIRRVMLAGVHPDMPCLWQHVGVDAAFFGDHRQHVSEQPGEPIDAALVRRPHAFSSAEK